VSFSVFKLGHKTDHSPPSILGLRICGALLPTPHNLRLHDMVFNLGQVQFTFRSRDSVVGIATSYGLDDQGVGVGVPVRSIIFTSPNRPDRL
jgi:hypothetical protein